MTLHELLDYHYGPDGDAALENMLQKGADQEVRQGPFRETALHVAARRRRLSAIKILIQHRADPNAQTAGGKTAYVHAARRGFSEVSEFLAPMTIGGTLTPAYRLAMAIVQGRAEEAERILAVRPGSARTGKPEEDRLLADMAGRNPTWPVSLLIAAGADLSAPGLEDGTPLHQAAWFGQPASARLLIDAGAPREVFDRCHRSAPLGWVAHGSRFSGSAGERQVAYVAIAEMLLRAGAALTYPNDSGRAYFDRLLQQASRAVRSSLLERAKSLELFNS